jgi:hypothetical protein
VLDII